MQFLRGFVILKKVRGYSSAGRALESHSRGQRFDPAYLHHYRSQKPEARGRRPEAEVRSQKPEARGQRPEAEVRSQRPETGGQRTEFGRGLVFVYDAEPLFTYERTYGFGVAEVPVILNEVKNLTKKFKRSFAVLRITLTVKNTGCSKRNIFFFSRKSLTNRFEIEIIYPYLTMKHCFKC